MIAIQHQHQAQQDLEALAEIVQRLEACEYHNGAYGELANNPYFIKLKEMAAGWQNAECAPELPDSNMWKQLVDIVSAGEDGDEAPLQAFQFQD